MSGDAETRGPHSDFETMDTGSELMLRTEMKGDEYPKGGETVTIRPGMIMQGLVCRFTGSSLSGKYRFLAVLANSSPCQVVP